MNIQLSDNFTYKRLLRFTLPSIGMLIFSSIYTVVDGFFVANVVGKNALASINIVMPIFILVGACGFMLGTGGSAEVAKKLGEGDKKKAQEYFTLLILTILIIGVVLSSVSYVLMEPLARLAGATDLIVEDCVTYGRVISIGMIAFMLQMSFQSFFIAAEKPHLGFRLTVLAGMTNIVLDYLLVYQMQMGIQGAAIATVLGSSIGGLIPFVYFSSKNSSLLKFVKPDLDIKMLLRSSVNGSSEMVNEISMSVIVFLYNWQMLRLVGEDGVAAISVIMYVNFIFIASIIGFSIGVSPIISFNYGADNREELKNVFKKSLVIIGIISGSVMILAEIFAGPLVGIFVGNDQVLSEMATKGFRLYALAFLISGINIFGSAFFTALCNGKISAIISFLRTLLFQSVMIIALPIFLGINGVWLAIVVAELLAGIVTTAFLIKYRKRYGY